MKNLLLVLLTIPLLFGSCKKDDDDNINPSEQIIPTFEMNYGGTSGDIGYSVKQTTDGGFIVTGSTIITGGNVIQGFDQEYVYLLKTNKNGVEEWSKTLGDTNTYSCYGKNIQLTSDGGYIIVGYVEVSGNREEVYLIKTDGNGNEQWSKTFGGTYEDYGYSLKQTTDGGFIITGVTYSGSQGDDVYLIKTDGNGNEQWSKTFGGSGTDNEWGNSVQQTNDGGYIITGVTYGGSQGDDVYLIKTDGNGNEQWYRTFGGWTSDRGYSVKQTVDGGYIISGSTKSFGNGNHGGNGESDVYLIKTDGNGNEEWSKTFGGIRNDIGNSVEQTIDGGYIIVGKTLLFVQNPNPTNSGYEVYLIKTDGNGNRQWSKSFGETGGGVGNSVEQTTDGGYIITGSTFGNVYLIKTDENGDVNP